MKHIDIPPVWLLACAFTAWFLAKVVPIYTVDVSRWLTGVLVGGGVYLIVWSALWFRKRKTSIEPRRTPKTLIVEGPFHLNRNPIYTGFTAILLGLALWFGALTAILPVLAFPWVIYRRFIRREEETLRSEFGEEAEDYFKKTRRW